MDRELSKSERNSIRRKRLMPYLIGLVALVVVVAALLLLMRQSVKRADLLVATVDTGVIETSVTGSGSVVPAFEEIINSPINTRIVEVYCKAGDSVDRKSTRLNSSH